MSAAAVALDVPHSILLANSDSMPTVSSPAPRSGSRRFPSPSPSIVSSASSSSSYKRPREDDDEDNNNLRYDERNSDSHKHKRVSSQDAVYAFNRPSWPFSTSAAATTTTTTTTTTPTPTAATRDLSVSQLSQLSSFASPVPLTSALSSPHLIYPDHSTTAFAAAVNLQHDWQEATRTHARAQASYDSRHADPSEIVALLHSILDACKRLLLAIHTRSSVSPPTPASTPAPLPSPRRRPKHHARHVEWPFCLPFSGTSSNRSSDNNHHHHHHHHHHHDHLLGHPSPAATLTSTQMYTSRTPRSSRISTDTPSASTHSQPRIPGSGTAGDLLLLPKTFHAVLGSTLYMLGHLILAHPFLALPGDATSPIHYWLLAADVFQMGETTSLQAIGRSSANGSVSPQSGRDTFPEDWKSYLIWGRTLACIAGDLLDRRCRPSSPEPEPLLQPPPPPCHGASSASIGLSPALPDPALVVVNNTHASVVPTTTRGHHPRRRSSKEGMSPPPPPSPPIQQPSSSHAPAYPWPSSSPLSTLATIRHPLVLLYGMSSIRSPTTLALAPPHELMQTAMDLLSRGVMYMPHEEQITEGGDAATAGMSVPVAVSAAVQVTTEEENGVFDATTATTTTTTATVIVPTSGSSSLAAAATTTTLSTHSSSSSLSSLASSSYSSVPSLALSLSSSSSSTPSLLHPSSSSSLSSSYYSSSLLAPPPAKPTTKRRHYRRRRESNNNKGKWTRAHELSLLARDVLPVVERLENAEDRRAWAAWLVALLESGAGVGVGSGGGGGGGGGDGGEDGSSGSPRPSSVSSLSTEIGSMSPRGRVDGDREGEGMSTSTSLLAAAATSTSPHADIHAAHGHEHALARPHASNGDIIMGAGSMRDVNDEDGHEGEEEEEEEEEVEEHVLQLFIKGRTWLCLGAARVAILAAEAEECTDCDKNLWEGKVDDGYEDGGRVDSSKERVRRKGRASRRTTAAKCVTPPPIAREPARVALTKASSLFDQVQSAFECCLSSSCLSSSSGRENDYHAQLQEMRKQLSEALTLLVRLEEEGEEAENDNL